MTKVSVIVPIYNVKGYMQRCIESVIGQTYKELEIILVDDGSKDGSEFLCNSYADMDARICVIHKKNGGLSSARNAGIEKATGEYLLFLDGDDYYIPETVETLMAVAKRYPYADIIQFRYVEIAEDQLYKGDKTGHEGVCHRDTRQFFEKLYELGGVAASGCTKLIRRTSLGALRFKEGILHEDEFFTTRLLQQVAEIVYIDAELYCYVMRNGSIIKSSFRPKKTDVLMVGDDRMAALDRLGYNDLLMLQKRRQFVTAAMLYCEAKSNGFKKEAQGIQDSMVRLGYIPGLRGQFALLNVFMQMSKYVLNGYYYFRRLIK